MSESTSSADARRYASSVTQTVRGALLVLDAGLRVKVATPLFYDTFQATPEQTLGRSLYELGNGQWNIPALRQLLDELVLTGVEFDDYQVAHDFPGIGRRTMLLNARRLQDADPDGAWKFLLAIEDISGRRPA